MHHKKAGNTKLGESGITVTTGRRWSWCSPPAVPGYSETEWSGWPGIPGHKRQLTLGLNALTLTDITKNAAYGSISAAWCWKSIIPQHKEEQEAKQMLKTNSLRESMLHGCRCARLIPRNSPFSWRAATLKRRGNALVCLPLSDGDVCHGLRGELDDLTLPLLAWLSENQPRCCSTLSVIRTSNSPPLSMT